MATKKNKFKSFTNTIKEMRKTQNGKAILFFGFYFIFFLVIIIFIRIVSNLPGANFNYDYNDNGNGNTYTNGLYTFDKILANNYKFNFTVNVDGATVIYNGEKLDKTEKFTVNGVDYYYDGVDYYTVDFNNVWDVTSNPYTYYDFTNFVRLGEVLVDATYISKTEYGNGDAIFNYLISSNSIIDVIEEVDTDIDEIPNKVVFTSSGENRHLNKIELDLSSYGKYKGICLNNFNITLEYYDFGDVLEINSPLR